MAVAPQPRTRPAPRAGTPHKCVQAISKTQRYIAAQFSSAHDRQPPMTLFPTGQGVQFAWLLAGLTWACSAQAQSGRLAFEITGLASNNGAVHCLLFATAAGFPTEARRATKQMAAPPEDLRATCEFTDMAAGTYALSVWHDTNANGRLDANLLGIPSEPVGTSNNAEGRIGPPRFEAAAFTLVPPLFRQRITVK
jgi:uncharacterized protein (DUF2141 family)